MFHKLRSEVLQTALGRLEPRPLGRPSATHIARRRARGRTGRRSRAFADRASSGPDPPGTGRKAAAAYADRPPGRGKKRLFPTTAPRSHIGTRRQESQPVKQRPREKSVTCTAARPTKRGWPAQRQRREESAPSAAARWPSTSGQAQLWAQAPTRRSATRRLAVGTLAHWRHRCQRRRPCPPGPWAAPAIAATPEMRNAAIHLMRSSVPRSAKPRCGPPARRWPAAKSRTSRPASAGSGGKTIGGYCTSSIGISPAPSGPWTTPNRPSLSTASTATCSTSATWPAGCNSPGCPWKTKPPSLPTTP